jgi:acetaldehyde dehydrogenase (acetylating)
MKAFMEEYGVIVVAAIIITIVAAIATSSIGPTIRDGITDTVGALTDTLDVSLDAIGGSVDGENVE